MTSKNDIQVKGSKIGLFFFLILATIIFLFFNPSFTATQALFANDCPLGLVNSHAQYPFAAFTGYWFDLNWIGGQYPGGSPTVTQLLYLLLGSATWKEAGSLIFIKFYTPVSLILLGLSAWVLFRQFKFSPYVCLVAALAVALNTNPFSTGCWGLSSWTLAHTMITLAIAAIVAASSGRPLIKWVLAGAATGMAVMEGFDMGAILSLYVAAFAFYCSFIEGENIGKNTVSAFARVAVIAVVACIVAAHALSALINTQIKGVAGMKQDTETKARRWDEATQWSLPKKEAVRVLIPGVFGYRMDTSNGGAYWGTVGMTPGWEQHHQGITRYSGSGEYAGLLVLLLAAYAFLSALRKKNSPFTERERKIIWFLTGAAVLSLLFAFGRHAPFYQLLYQLPFFSTIRNPIKFMHPFQIMVGILFGFGLEALSRVYLQRVVNHAGSFSEQLKSWWKKTEGFERNWFYGLFGFGLISALGFLVFAGSKSEITRFLQSTGFDAGTAQSIFSFSQSEVLMYLAFLLIAVVLLVLIACGSLAGSRARLAWICLGLLVVTDLVRANAPWMIYYDYTYKYASNPIIKKLAEKPHENRVRIFPFQVNDAMSYLQRLYSIEWAQHHFPYNRIQSADVTQEPRQAEDNKAYRAAFRSGSNLQLFVREWELTNTRYILGMAGGFVDQINKQFDPGKNRFRVHTGFTLEPKKQMQQPQVEDMNAVEKTDGPFALIEFTGALPRAKLYSNWQVITNDDAALKLLADMNFDPHRTVLVSEPVKASEAPSNSDAGSVEFASYAPKQIKLNAKAEQPSILLLNDKHHPDWKVWVDGKPAELLKCNYLMRGVYLDPGSHVVEFRFEPKITMLLISLGAIGIALVLCIVLAIKSRLQAES